MNELTIVWNRAKSVSWESTWIEYLFRNIPHTTIENLNHDQFIDNSVIVDSLCWAPYHNSYVKELAARNFKFGLIHLSDETTRDNIDSYKHCRFVLRNYFREQVADNVMHIPLGWNDGFTDATDNGPITSRKHVWSFVGERWDHNRNVMAAEMSRVPNGNLYVVHHTGPRLNPTEMGKLYRDSIFVPCPRGAISMDNFRVTEALEAGCIPIVEKSDYWFKMHGDDFPALQISDWNTAPDLISKYLISPMELETLRLRCSRWWHDKKDQLTSSVETLFNTTML